MDLGEMLALQVRRDFTPCSASAPNSTPPGSSRLSMTGAALTRFHGGVLRKRSGGKGRSRLQRVDHHPRVAHHDEPAAGFDQSIFRHALQRPNRHLDRGPRAPSRSAGDPYRPRRGLAGRRTARPRAAGGRGSGTVEAPRRGVQGPRRLAGHFPLPPSPSKSGAGTRASRRSQSAGTGCAAHRKGNMRWLGCRPEGINSCTR